LDLRERRDARDAQDLVPVTRPHGDAAVAGLHQVAHDAVARPIRVRRRADDGDRLRLTEDLCGRLAHEGKAIFGSVSEVADWCEPGTFLAVAGQDAALDVLVGLLPRLWKPAGAPFRTLAEEAAHWVDGLRARGGYLADAAVRALDELAPSQGEQVLLHQDLH